MREEIEKIRNELFGTLSEKDYTYIEIFITKILQLLQTTIDNCEDEIADLLFDEFYAAHSTTTRIINIIKERCK